MASPTRFPGGVTNREHDDPLGQLGMLDPTRYHTFFTDFDNYAAADWIVTTTEAGAGDATEAVDAGADGGILVLTNDAADNDLDFLQWSGTDSSTTVETFKFATGKKLFFKSRFKLNDGNSGIAQVDAVIGLQITDTTALAVTDGVYFLKTDGAATLDFKTMLNSTATTTTVGTMVYDTYHEVAFYYDGKTSAGSEGHVFAWFDGVRAAAHVTTNLVTDEELTVSFGVQNGQANAAIMSIDYIFVAKER